MCACFVGGVRAKKTSSSVPLQGDLIRAVNGVDVDAYTILDQIRLSRDAVGTAISLNVDRCGEQLDVVLLRQRLDSVSRAEAMVGLLMEHGNLIQQLSGLENVRQLDGSIRNLCHQMQSSFESVQMQFGEMQHEAWQAEHNLATYLNTLQDTIKAKLVQAEKVLQSKLVARPPSAGVEGPQQETVEQLELALSSHQGKILDMQHELSAKRTWAASLEQQLHDARAELGRTQAILQESDQAVKELETIQLAAVADLEKKQQAEVQKVLRQLGGLEQELNLSRTRNYDSEQERAAMIKKVEETTLKCMEVVPTTSMLCPIEGCFGWIWITGL